MSAEATSRRETAVGRGVSTLDNIGYRLQRLPIHLVIIIFCAIWIIPTFGMVINSFRSLQDMGNAGWWTTLFPPHGFTLASYQQVLQIDGVPESILYSIPDHHPATVIQRRSRRWAPTRSPG
jgi:alpha-glucoside transport system permease protein